MTKRYKIVSGSESAHCCFEYTVVDTLKPTNWDKERYEPVCEVFTKADAKLICDALNASEKHKVGNK